jgi:ribosomal protein S18 acetylase RimI-like enzyme
MAHELALFHKEDLTPDPVKLLTDSNWFSASIVSVQNLDVGFCAWYKIYACQSASRIYELQSLYVLLPYRGLQIATRMVRELAKLALADQAVIGIGVRKENLMALAFYKKIGCTVLDRNDIWHWQKQGYRIW